MENRKFYEIGRALRNYRGTDPVNVVSAYESQSSKELTHVIGVNQDGASLPREMRDLRSLELPTAVLNCRLDLLGELLQLAVRGGPWEVSRQAPLHRATCKASPRTPAAAPSGRAATTANSALALLAKYLSPVTSQQSPAGRAIVSTAAPKAENLNSNWLSKLCTRPESDSCGLQTLEQGIPNTHECWPLWNFHDHAIICGSLADIADLKMEVAVIGLDVDLSQIALQRNHSEFMWIDGPIRSSEPGSVDTRRRWGCCHLRHRRENNAWVMACRDPVLHARSILVLEGLSRSTGDVCKCERGAAQDK